MIPQARLHGVVREDADGHIAVDGAQLAQDRLQDRVVPGVSLAVGPADHHAGAFFAPGAGAAEDGLVNFDLVRDGRVDGEFLGRALIQALGQLAAQGGVLRKGGDVRAERVYITRLKKKACHAVFDQIRYAANVGRDGRAAHPRALGERIRERLGERRERVHVQRIVKAVHIGLPACEYIASRRAAVLCQLLQLGALLAVARDDQADIRSCCRAFAEGADERSDVLHRREPRRDAVHHGVPRQPKPERGAILFPRFRGRARRKVHAVIDGKHRLRVKAARDEQLRHRVGHADVIVKQPQSDGVDRAVGQAVQRPSEIVQPVVAVHRGDDGHMDLPAQDRARHVGARAVAVDDLIALAADLVRQGADGLRDGA